MKWLAVLVILVTGAGVASFRKFAPFREAVRHWNASNSEKPAFDAYLEGKSLLRNSWAGDPGAEYAAWGDDRSVYAKSVTQDIWKAHGRVTYSLLGATVTHPWMILFHRDPPDAIAARVGLDADETIQRAEEQLLAYERKAAQEAAATPRPGAPAAQPKRGDWMFKNYKPALDPPSRR